MDNKSKETYFPAQMRYFLYLGGIVAIAFLAFRLFIADDKNPSPLTNSYSSEIAAAFVGTLLTVIVTALLLEQTTRSQQKLLEHQTKTEESKERKVELYKAKLLAYQELMGTIETIILDVTPDESGKTETDSTQIEKAKIQLDLQCQKTIFIADGDVPNKLREFVDKFSEVIEDGLVFTYQDD